MLLVEIVVPLLIHGAVIVSILVGQRRQPSATLAWILAVALIPFVGIGLYLLIGRTKTRRIVRRTRRAARALEPVLERYGVRVWQPLAGLPQEERRTCDLIVLGERLKSARASRLNKVAPLDTAAATYRAMLEAIEEARHHVHLLFYIIQPDRAGEGFRDRLATCARRGVAVKVMVDAVGSASLPDGFWAPLLEAGGQVAVFNPVSAFTSSFRRRDRVDFRNHRKLLIVDGRIAFTGGINIGREYLGLDPEIGHWRDTHLKLTGPAVLSLQEVFALDWLSAVDRDESLVSWFPEPELHEGGCLVEIVDSGPDTEWAPVEQIYLYAIAQARQRVWLATPYFVPSAALEAMLFNAGMRGIDVRILLPERADSLLVNLASRSYFDELLGGGVRIFLYERGFMHAKTLVVDDWMGTVGSANMDNRSFHLNFELNAFVFDQPFCQELARQFLVDLGHAREHTLEDEKRLGLGRTLLQQTSRLFSPLL
jgi:cardiolipin synthase A/B